MWFRGTADTAVICNDITSCWSAAASTYPHLTQRLEGLLMWRVLLQQRDAIIDEIDTAVNGIQDITPAEEVTDRGRHRQR